MTQVQPQKKRKLNSKKWKAIDTGFGFEGLLSLEVLEDYSDTDLKEEEDTTNNSENVNYSGNVELDDVPDVLVDNPFEEDMFEPMILNESIFDDDPFGQVQSTSKFAPNSSFPGWCCPLPSSMVDFTPSSIQQQSFKWYERNKRTPGQVLIAAQTGSGKTLAFVLPLVHRLLTVKGEASAIVLAPTRELVNQLTAIVSSVVSQFDGWKVIKLQGGISQDKQERQLGNASDFKKLIIIASPGRLGDLSQSLPLLTNENSDIDSQIDRITMPEVKTLFKLFYYCEWLALDEYENLKGLDGIDHIGATLRRVKLINSQSTPWHMQFYTSCSSATPSAVDSTQLLDIIPFQPHICNIDCKKNPNIHHLHMDCSTMIQKDLATYYLLHKYTGKSAIFMNSLDGVRRLSAVLRLLFPQKSVKTLRGDMKMATRLQVVETFLKTKNCILVASDVAARGLDIVDTECVIHYDIPKDNDIYVHRSGRTARYERKGIAIALCSPDDIKKYTRMTKQMAIKSKLLRMEPSTCDYLTKRLNLAREIEKDEHDKRKSSAQMRQAVEMERALDLETDKPILINNKSDIKRKKKLLNQELNVNIDQMNRKRGTTVITPDMYDSFSNTSSVQSFLTLAK